MKVLNGDSKNQRPERIIQFIGEITFILMRLWIGLSTT